LGLLVYSLDEVTSFDPLDLDIDVTPARVFECLENGAWMDALLMAMRLNEASILRCVLALALASVPSLSGPCSTQHLSSKSARLMT